MLQAIFYKHICCLLVSICLQIFLTSSFSLCSLVQLLFDILCLVQYFRWTGVLLLFDSLCLVPSCMLCDSPFSDFLFSSVSYQPLVPHRWFVFPCYCLNLFQLCVVTLLLVLFLITLCLCVASVSLFPSSGCLSMCHCVFLLSYPILDFYILCIRPYLSLFVLQRKF